MSTPRDVIKKGMYRNFGTAQCRPEIWLKNENSTDRALLNISCNFGGAIADEQKLWTQAADTWDKAGIGKSRNRQGIFCS